MNSTACVGVCNLKHYSSHVDVKSSLMVTHLKNEIIEENLEILVFISTYTWTKWHLGVVNSVCGEKCVW